MFWVVQRSFYSEEGTERLLETLERFGIPHEVVVIDEAGKLEPEVSPEGLVMCCGTYALARIAAERGWLPGTFWNDNHDHRAWVANWGGRMLNAEAVTCRVSDVVPAAPRVFLRPAQDNKFFDGLVLDADELAAWRDAIVAGRPPQFRCSAKVGPDTLVTHGPAFEVYREARFFVLDGEIVTWSTYRVGTNVVASPDVDPAALDLVRDAVRDWQPARGFVLDAAFTDVGWKLVELNCLNMSGFYGADVQRLVMAVEDMDFNDSRVPGRMPGAGTLPDR